MTFFNLKRLARLLAILLAILPMSELTAGSLMVSDSTAINIFDNLNDNQNITAYTKDSASNVAQILSLAGYPGALQAALTGANVSTSSSTAQTLTATLTYVFNTSMKKYSNTSNLSYQVVQGLYQTYNKQAQSILAAISNQQAPTISAVSTAMQSLIILLAASLYGYDDQFMKPANALALPLTGQTIQPSTSNNGTSSAHQYMLNNFVQELSDWIQYYVAAVTSSVNSITIGQLQAAAKQLGLTPPSGTSMATAMQNVINTATDASGNLCNAAASLQSQISCAFAWYQAQLAIIIANTNNGIVTNNLTANITPMIDTTTNSIFQIKPAASGTPVVPNIVAASNALNGAVTDLANTINGYQTSYVPQIQAATTVANVTALFNSALSAVNAAYPAILSATGAIATQDGIVTGLEKTVNQAISTLNAACPSSPLTVANAAYTAAQSAYTTVYNTATTDFPVDLPGSLTASTAANYATSIPGDVISNLYQAEQDAITAITSKQSGIVKTAVANVAALNSATSAAQALFVQYTSAPSTVALVAASSSGLQTAINQVNTIYNSTIAAGSAYGTALAAANTLLAQLNGLQNTAPQTTGLAAAITAMQAALNSANAAFPQDPSDIVFSVANSTGSGQAVGSVTAAQMVASVPGTAVAALNALSQSGNIKSVTANVTALNSATSAAQALFVQYTSAPSTVALIAASTGGLQTAINQVNTIYNSTIAAGSAYGTALAAANTLLAQLNGLQNTAPQTTGLAAAITAMQAALNSANAAFPQDPSDIVFSVANSTGSGQAVGSVTAAQMVASVPGTAVAALNALVPNTLAATLNSVVASATSKVQADQATGVANIKAASSATTAAVLATAVGVINTDYTNILSTDQSKYTAVISPSSPFMQVFSVAQAAQAPASSALGTALTAATAAFPTPSITFSATSTTLNAPYKTSVPGVAVAALYNAASSGGGGLSRGDIAAMILVPILGMIIGLAAAKLWAKNAEGEKAVQGVENSNETTEEMQETAKAVGNAKDPADVDAALVGKPDIQAAVGKAVVASLESQYGLESGSLVDSGIMNSDSSQIVAEDGAYVNNLLGDIQNAGGSPQDAINAVKAAGGTDPLADLVTLTNDIAKGYIQPGATQADLQQSITDSNAIQDAAKDQVGLEDIPDMQTFEALVRGNMPPGTSVEKALGTTMEDLNKATVFTAEQAVQVVARLEYVNPADGLRDLVEVATVSANGITIDTPIDQIKALIAAKVPNPGQTGGGGSGSGGSDDLNDGGAGGQGNLSESQIQAAQTRGRAAVQDLQIGSDTYNAVINDMNSALQTAYNDMKNADEADRTAKEAAYEELKAEAQAIDGAAGDDGESGIHYPDEAV